MHTFCLHVWGATSELRGPVLMFLDVLKSSAHVDVEQTKLGLRPRKDEQNSEFSKMNVTSKMYIAL